MKRLISLFIVFLLLFCFPLSVYAAEGDPPPDDGGILGGLIDGLKGLFIPDEAFFAAFNSEIRAAVDQKTGGLASTFQTITDNFKALETDRAVNSALNLTLPDGHLYPGYKGKTVNVLQGLDSFAVWFRGLFSAFLVIITVIHCYRKAVSLFKG